MSLPFYFIYLSALCFRRQTATAVENSLLHLKFKLNNDLSAPRGFVTTQTQSGDSQGGVQGFLDVNNPAMGGGQVPQVCRSQIVGDSLYSHTIYNFWNKFI